MRLLHLAHDRGVDQIAAAEACLDRPGGGQLGGGVGEHFGGAARQPRVEGQVVHGRRGVLGVQPAEEVGRDLGSLLTVLPDPLGGLGQPGDELLQCVRVLGDHGVGGGDADDVADQRRPARHHHRVGAQLPDLLGHVRLPGGDGVHVALDHADRVVAGAERDDLDLAERNAVGLQVAVQVLLVGGAALGAELLADQALRVARLDAPVRAPDDPQRPGIGGAGGVVHLGPDRLERLPGGASRHQAGVGGATEFGLPGLQRLVDVVAAGEDLELDVQAILREEALLHGHEFRQVQHVVDARQRDGLEALLACGLFRAAAPAPSSGEPQDDPNRQRQWLEPHLTQPPSSLRGTPVGHPAGRIITYIAMSIMSCQHANAERQGR